MPRRLLFAPLAVLIILAGCGKPASHAAAEPRPDPPPSLDDQVKRVDLEKTCADQAAKAFRSADYPRKANVINTYTNHYAARAGKCFMVVNIYDTSDEDNASTFETVEDAFEGRRLGSFFAQNGQSGPSAGHVVTCEEKPVAAKAKSCKSKAEWDAFKARYMDAN